VRIQDNMQLPADTYCVRIKEIEAGRGVIRPTKVLAMDPTGGVAAPAGEQTTEPAFGLPAKWIEPNAREEAEFRGCSVVDPASVMCTHLTEIVKQTMAELLSFPEAQKLLDDLPRDQQKLVSDLIPSQISLGGVQRLLQALLAERVSIRDLATILVGMQEVVAGQARLTEFMQSFRAAFDKATRAGESPALLTGSGIRFHVRAIVERIRPSTPVLAQTEIFPRARIRTFGALSCEAPRRRPWRRAREDVSGGPHRRRHGAGSRRIGTRRFDPRHPTDRRRHGSHRRARER
jgi:flagellar biosynthesis component FlhA